MYTASPRDGSAKIWFEVHGEGHPLLLAFPLVASQAELFGAAGAAQQRGFLDRLTDRYRVLLVDYPSLGRSDTIPPAAFTADRVCADLLAVADAAGFERFAVWGYSWGANAALQLASRTARLSALVLGGWSPLGGHYAELLRGARLQAPAPSASNMLVLRDAAQYAQWITYGESVLGWDESGTLARLTCPRLVYTGERGDSDAGGVPLPIASTIIARRAELEALGWQAHVIANRDFAVGLDAAAVVPPVRAFLDAVLERA